MLAEIARRCHDRRRFVLACWILALVLVVVLSQTMAGREATSFSVPGTESQQAIDTLKVAFPARSGDTANIVFEAPGRGGVEAVRNRVEAAVVAARTADPHITEVVGPFDPSGPSQVSVDGRVAFAEIRLGVAADDVSNVARIAIANAITTAAGHDPALRVAFTGSLFTSDTAPGGTEAIALAAAAVILLVAFGSLLAMLVPVLVAVVSIAMALGLIALVANVTKIATFTGFVAAMIGLGVGIDYALFIVTRYRRALRDGSEPRDAVSSALTTAGRAVLFAGCIVVVSLLGLVLMGIPVANGVAVGAALAVVVTMVASVTLLPALFGFIGHGIDRFRVPFRRNADDDQHGFWWRWSRRIQHRPMRWAAGSLLLLLSLSIPVLGLRLGFPDQGNDPPGSPTRQGYDLMSRGFGSGYNGPLVVVMKVATPSDRVTVERLVDRLRADPGSASVSSPQSNATPGVAGSTEIVTVTPRTAPQDAATATWVRHIRRDVIEPVVSGSDVTVKTTGATAYNIDTADKVANRLPWFFGGVIVFSFILLMAVFRSLLVPLKAAIMNLLSIGATCGILVAIFQWGWGGSLIGVSKQPIAAFVPMMLFAILFGLSMDYEVFLLSRVKEEHDRTGDNARAVADGLAATGRVITAAAAIMVTVFVSFVLLPDPIVKMFGLGLALAILIDATVVRMVLVPATMELLGEANWWLPKWLDAVLPKIRTERGTDSEEPVDPEHVGVAAMAGR